MERREHVNAGDAVNTPDGTGTVRALLPAGGPYVQALVQLDGGERETYDLNTISRRPRDTFGLAPGGW